jgi:DNA-binding PadR family transcriptional regulator
MDGTTFEGIKTDITNSVEKYIPNLTINEITITPYLDDLESQGELNMDKLGVGGIYRLPGRGVEEYTAKLRIDYTITDSTFQSKDFIIINI